MTPSTSSPQRILVLTLDAFSTIYTPRAPIFNQYLSVARHIHFPLPSSIPPPELEQRVGRHFKTSFKETYKQSPNYGRATGMGPKEWWAEVVRGCFGRLVVEAEEEVGQQQIQRDEGVGTMKELEDELYDHFASEKGYILYDDARGMFDRLRGLRKSFHTQPPANISSSLSSPSSSPKDCRIFIGVLTNSDPRATSVLRSLGLRVGDITAADDETVDPLPPTPSSRANLSPETMVQKETSISSSNTNTPRFSLDNDIDFVITSYEAGYEKPATEIFEVVQRVVRKKLLTSPSPATATDNENTIPSASDPIITHLHIGDDWAKDVLGAEKAGWKALYLDRREGSGPSPGEGGKQQEQEQEEREKKRINSLEDERVWSVVRDSIGH